MSRVIVGQNGRRTWLGREKSIYGEINKNIDRLSVTRQSRVFAMRAYRNVRIENTRKKKKGREH